MDRLVSFGRDERAVERIEITALQCLRAHIGNTAHPVGNIFADEILHALVIDFLDFFLGEIGTSDTCESETKRTLDRGALVVSVVGGSPSSG